MLDANLQKQLTTYLQNLKHTVQLTAFLDASGKSDELRALVQQIDGMSDLIELTVFERANNGERTPSMLIENSASSSQVRFAGLPMGHEFTSLVLALLHSGGHPMKLEQDIQQQVRKLPNKLHFETYISLSCQNCPDVVQALNMMSVLNPNITHIMVDGGLFPDEIEQRKIMSVPTVFLNGAHFGQGRMTLAEVLNKVDSGASERQAEKLNQKEPFDVLILGGGPAGAAAAIYAARKGIRTGVVSERFGGQVLDTMSIENFISVPKTDGPKLAAHLEEHVKSYDVDIMDNQRVKALVTGVDGSLNTVHLESGAKLQSKTVVIATGARWREIDVPGEQQYRNKGVAYCPHCDGPLYKGKSVAVVGGGNSGIEAAIDLAGIVKDVTVLEFADSLKADEVLIRKANSMDNIRIIKSALTTEVLGDGDKVTGLRYKNRNDDRVSDLSLEGIFVQIGLVPNTEFLEGVVNTSPFGEIEINARAQTSVPSVFAAGDCTTVPYKQIIIAMGEGTTAALSAFDYLIRH